MTEVEKILRMIEEVDPADTAKLDEIDARAHNFFLGFTEGPVNDRYDWGWCTHNGFILNAPKYTRSRDALKEIRPDDFVITQISQHPKRGFIFNASDTNGVTHTTPFLPTETLAKLHAIIQAIAYERKNND